MTTEREISVSAPGGDIIIADVDIGAAARFLAALNGRRSWPDAQIGSGLSEADARAIGAALLEVDALVDARASWQTFHRHSSNPLPYAPSLRPRQAEGLARWSPPANESTCTVSPADTALGRLASQRHSFERPHGAIDRDGSAAVTARLLASAYSPRPTGGRSVASAGALYPLQLWALVPVADGVTVSTLVDDPALVQTGVMAEATYRALFVADENLDTALAAGASTIVIAADPTRTVAKYGDRGWRFALLEAGALAHHLELLAVEAGACMRPVGGFYDKLLLIHVGGLIPVHCLVTFVVCDGP